MSMVRSTLEKMVSLIFSCEKDCSERRVAMKRRPFPSSLGFSPILMIRKGEERRGK